MAELKHLLFFLTFIVLASAFIGYIAWENYSIRMDAVGIDLSNYREDNILDFSTVNTSNLSSFSGYTLIEGSFNITEYGLTSSSENKNKVFFDSISENVVETNTYYIYNPNHLEYSICGYELRPLIFINVIGEYTGIINEYGWINVNSNGINIITDNSNSLEYLSLNLNEDEEINITTVWNKETEFLTVKLEGSTIINKSMELGSIAPISKMFYAGIEVTGEGLAISKIESSSFRTSTSSDIWSSIGIFINVIQTALGYKPEIAGTAIMPLWFILIMFTIPTVGIIYIILKLLRGGG